MSNEEWLPVGIVVEGQALAVGGVDVWDSVRWVSEHRAIVLQHAGERHRVFVYTLPDQEPPVRLAIGEVSAGVYAVGVSPPSTSVER